jgi:hypothetical protein
MADTNTTQERPSEWTTAHPEYVARMAGAVAPRVQHNDDLWRFTTEQVHRFAQLIAEECAKVAEATYEGGCTGCDESGFDFYGESSAAAIRAKFGVNA